ncbi:MAG: hypothetical protein ABW104_11595 [Candidatus Thiodiazotropha sp. 6PLUC2]
MANGENRDEFPQIELSNPWGGFKTTRYSWPLKLERAKLKAALEKKPRQEHRFPYAD